MAIGFGGRRVGQPQAACELEADDGPQRFKERVGKLVKHKPVGRELK